MVIRYSVVLRSRKLPMGLLVDPQKRSAANLLEVEGFGAVFGPKKTRKKPKLSGGVSSVDDLVASSSTKAAAYDEGKDTDVVKGAQRAAGQAGREARFQRQAIMAKGQSPRIWAELCVTRARIWAGGRAGGRWICSSRVVF